MRSSEICAESEVRDIICPTGTDSWYPLPHHHVLDSARETLTSSGYCISNETHALSKGGLRYFCVMDLTAPIGESEKLTVGIRNAHDKSFSIGFCVGVRTLVCSNLAFSADIVLAKKHTRFGDSRYRDGIVGAVQKLANFADVQQARIADMKGSFVSKEEAESLILRAGEEKIIGWQTVPKVLAEYRQPSHEEHHDLTRYSLLQAFTQVMKERFVSQPLAAARETILLHEHLAV